MKGSELALPVSYGCGQDHLPANFAGDFAPSARSTARPGDGRISHRTPLAYLADGQLVTLALNGDAKAFPQLMGRYGDKIRGIIAKRVRYPDEADELVQDTLLSAWAALQTYPAAQPFDTWLVCIALNKCRDWGRRRTVRQKAAPLLFDWGQSYGDTAEVELMDLQRNRRLHDAVARLPASLRAPLTLTALRDRTHEQAASELGLTVKGVETRVRRAKQWLRGELAEASA